MADRYCPRCGSALTVVREGGRDRQGCPACGQVLYRNPVPVAMAVAWRDDRILLVQRGNEPLHGFWAPPAGYVELDESVEAAAVRETQEETGLTIAVEGLQAAHSAPGIGVVLMVYRARAEAGMPVPGPEVLDVGFFAPEALPTQPVLAGGSELDRWFLGLLPELMGGETAGRAGRRRRMGELERRLRSLLAQERASHQGTSDASLERSVAPEVESLWREIDELRRLEEGG